MDSKNTAYIAVGVGFIGDHENSLFEVLLKEIDGRVVVFGTRQEGSEGNWDTDHEIWLGDMIQFIHDEEFKKVALRTIVQELDEDLKSLEEYQNTNLASITQEAYLRFNGELLDMDSH
ncbi:hypothetical protein ABHN11_24440 [Brevibacillus centrosporus]|uniref:hypothetical protein n=1 Tax=Brevibacillus centrosporus TaxID=54910 RepID=UPI003D204676